MLLAIDAGNTNISFAIYKDGKVQHVWRCRTESNRTADEYISWLYPLFMQRDLEFETVQGVIISSVVPDADFHFVNLCKRGFKLQPLMVNSHMIGQNLDLEILLDKPDEIGADRLVNALAVVHEHQCPAIVIDFGTATTFDVINRNGAYCGGVIAPGVNLSMQALHQAAAKLPRISIERPASVIGKNTVEAMQSGVYWGYVSMIEGLLNRLIQEMDDDPFVIATGGLADLYADSLPKCIQKVDKDLTLKGLWYIHSTLQMKKAA